MRQRPRICRVASPAQAANMSKPRWHVRGELLTLALLGLSACASSTAAKPAMMPGETYATARSPASKPPITPSAPGPGTHATARAGGPHPIGCRAEQLHVARDASLQYSGSTGEHEVALLFTNVSSRACDVSGYPSLSPKLIIAGQPLNFIKDGSVANTATSSTITIEPDQSAGVILTRFRCDAETSSPASLTVPITIGKPESHLSVTFQDYVCGGSIGNSIAVSRFMLASTDLPFCLAPTRCETL